MKKKFLKIGIIGSNEGNGHPISFSSIFNGYNKKYLKKFCKFNLINEYLPKYHKNKKSNIISNAKVTCIWTQSRKKSYEISKISNINHICKSIEEMSKKVDAVILARDDIENHLKFSEIFLKKGIPIFIDKLIVHDKKSLKIFNTKSKNKLYMSCSSARYTRLIEKIQKERSIIKKETAFIIGHSKKNWLRYAYHLLEGIVKIFGYDIQKVRCLTDKKDKNEIYQLIYKNGLNVSLFFSDRIFLPIKFTCLKKDSKALEVPYEDYFFSIKKMMQEFETMIRTGKMPISKKKMVNLSKIVIAGNLSKNNKNQFYSVEKLKMVK